MAGVELFLLLPSLDGEVTTALDALNPKLPANEVLPSSHFSVLMMDFEERTFWWCCDVVVGCITANVTLTSTPLLVMFWMRMFLLVK